jgi:hypothetical protein
MLEAVAERAQLALELLELTDETDRLFSVEGGGARAQHGERAAQRLQLVPPFHHDTNIRSHSFGGKGPRRRAC